MGSRKGNGIVMSKLIRVTLHEVENLFELSLRQAFESLEPKLRPPFSLDIPDQQEYLELNRALVYGVLCDSDSSKTHIKHLHALVTDGYAFFTSLLVGVVVELYGKLVDPAKIQLLWLTKEMVAVSSVGLEDLLVFLLRRIGSGDYSDQNVWLCSELVSMFLDNWDCLLEDFPLLLTCALYSFLRLLADQCRISGIIKLEKVKRLEIEFCMKMFREQMHLSLKIGRDLVRLLQDLVHVSEFREIWNDLVLNQCSDLSQIYQLKTSSRYFFLRITPEMETQLRFLFGNVKLGSQERHQIWFLKKYLLGPEKETLLIDIVRFICCVIHPTNEIIRSEIMPRWAMIGWFLELCRQNHHIERSFKLALFYDWLFYDEKIDNIMNVEPAALLMLGSIVQYPHITRSLLEFLLHLGETYDIRHRDMIMRGVAFAFRDIERKGVVRSLDVGDPVEERFKESSTRGSVIGQLDYCIKSYREAAVSNDPKFDHIELAEKQKVLNECVEAEAWLREKKQQQETLPKYATPAFLSADVTSKAEALDKFCKPIMTKPKPAVKADAPKAKEGEQADEGKSEPQPPASDEPMETEEPTQGSA